MNRSYRTAWWLLVLGGLMGLHRLYAGKTLSGGIMLGLNVGLLFVKANGVALGIIAALTLVTIFDLMALRDWFPAETAED